MFDPTSLSHRFKRGVTQAIHAFGPSHAYHVYDEEYEHMRRTYLQNQTIMENTRHYLRQFETGMNAITESLHGLSRCFQDFKMVYEEDNPSVRAAVPCYAFERYDSNTNVDEGAEQLKENTVTAALDMLQGISRRIHSYLTTDYVNVITAMLALHEPLDDLHKEIRTFQADIEVLQNDVTHMRNVIEWKGRTIIPMMNSAPSDAIAFSQVQQQKEIALSQWQKLILDGKGRVQQYNHDTSTFLRNLFTVTIQSLQSEVLGISRAMGTLAFCMNASCSNKYSAVMQSQSVSYLYPVEPLGASVMNNNLTSVCKQQESPTNEPKNRDNGTLEQTHNHQHQGEPELIHNQDSERQGDVCRSVEVKKEAHDRRRQKKKYGSKQS